MPRDGARECVLIVDDHPLFASAITDIMTQLAPDAHIEHATSIAEAKQKLAQQPALKLVLLDLGLPDSPASRSLKDYTGIFDGVPVVVISAHDDPLRVRQAMCGGAVGFISKSQRPPKIMADLKRVLAGERVAPELPDADALAQELPLSPRQCEVMDAMTAGQSNKEIARSLGVSPGTVKVHLREIFARLGAHNRTEAVALYNRAD